MTIPTECEKECAYGTCRGFPPCGGCCNCLSGCIVQYEEQCIQAEVRNEQTAEPAEEDGCKE